MAGAEAGVRLELGFGGSRDWSWGLEHWLGAGAGAV